MDCLENKQLIINELLQVLSLALEWIPDPDAVGEDHPEYIHGSAYYREIATQLDRQKLLNSRIVRILDMVDDLESCFNLNPLPHGGA